MINMCFSRFNMFSFQRPSVFVLLLGTGKGVQVQNSWHLVTAFLQNSWHLVTAFLQNSWHLVTAFLQNSWRLVTAFLQNF